MDSIFAPAFYSDPSAPHMEAASQAIHRTGGRQEAEKMRQAGREFEGFFISYLLKTMRETVHSTLLKNQAGEMFYSFYDQELGRLAAEAGGLGLGNMVETYIQQQSVPMAGEGLKFSHPSTDIEAGGGQSHHSSTKVIEGRN